MDPTAPQHLRLSIDYFFRSLAPASDPWPRLRIPGPGPGGQRVERQQRGAGRGAGVQAGTGF